tara:strand:+ start:77 stop:925 length:849 start_codon:yes stop_codon:yes gene_type:complete
MILLDFSQTMIGSFMAMSRGQLVVEEDLLRHTVLNTIRQYKQTHRRIYDCGAGPGLVICCDSEKNWRKEFFPEYKANRKKRREDDTTDWKSLFEFLNEMIEDLRNYFPYRVVKVDRAEADDIIAVLVQEEHWNPTLIISSDKDFIQLHEYEGVSQWSPLTKDWVTGDPKELLWEKLIRGDAGDGVPNILSSDDTFVTEGKRQRPISKKKMELWKADRNTWTEDMARNFNRNETMVDLSKSPESIRINIINEYKEQSPTHGRLMDYFVEKRLKNLMEHISEFE